LGHLLSVGMGIAFDSKLRNGPGRVFVVLGDGELDEGSVWEAMLVASALRLDNLVAVIDRNGLQANMRTEELVPLEPIAAKLQAFGWSAVRCDGHDFEAIGDAFDVLPFAKGSPTAIIADTVRGKGCPSLEGRVDRWFASFTPSEVERLLDELHGGAGAPLLTPGVIAR
jgi:transketolase